MDYDGRNQRRISGHKSTSGYSDWSPAGDAIAYMSYFSRLAGHLLRRPGHGQEGADLRRWASLNLSPSFAPDGRSIAFAHSRSVQRRRLPL